MFVPLKNWFYYSIKPLLPRSLQITARRRIAIYKTRKYSSTWPIDQRAALPPEGWTGWPEGNRFALVLQHDVDTEIGHGNVRRLMAIEEKLDVRSTFFIVPERYVVDAKLIDEIKQRGFGLGVHGLNHDGMLFVSYEKFRTQAAKINNYLDLWSTSGFSAPSMLHRLEWMHHFAIDYSTSTFDTDPIEPQPEGMKTIFPFWVKNNEQHKGFLEIPYTLAQDFTLFILLRERGIAVWKKKLDWIVQNQGMALVNSHPDYMQFDEKSSKPNTYPVQRYIDFIKYVRETYPDQYWQPLHKDLAMTMPQLVRKKITPADNRNSSANVSFEEKPCVCIIAKYIYPHDTRLSQQVGVLQRNNIPLDVLCLSYKNQQAIETDGLLTIHRLMEKPNKENFLAYLASTISFGIKAFAKLTQISLNKKYKVIIVHTLPEFLVFIGLLHRMLGKAIILDGRDITVELLSSRWQTKASKLLRHSAILVEKICMALCNEVITASPGFKRQLIKRGVPENKITVMVNTADINIFKYDEQRVFRPIMRRARFIYHGTVAERFGIATAVNAMPEVIARIPESELYIFGFFDKAYRLRIKKIITSLNLDKNVFLFESKPLDQIYKELITMDLGIVPYLSDNFMNLALSTKTFEYVASGLPVVASRLRSAEEIFSDQALHFAQPGDQHDLAEKIIELCENPVLQKSKSQKAFNEFQTHSSDAIGRLFLNLIHKYLRVPSSSREVWRQAVTH